MRSIGKVKVAMIGGKSVGKGGNFEGFFERKGGGVEELGLSFNAMDGNEVETRV